METTTQTGLQLDETSQSYLTDAAYWARFLSIIGFIISVVVAMVGLFYSFVVSTLINMSSGMESGPDYSALDPVHALIVILFAMLYFFPSIFLYRFATNMVSAQVTDHQGSLTRSFQNLKAWFKFVGIFMIASLCLSGFILFSYLIAMSSK